MDTLKLGQIITTEQHRDAIHIAVVPVVARAHLKAGEHVGAEGLPRNPVGIVDPFLLSSVEKGQTFWLYLYPGSITSLRHNWTHPAFPDDAKPARPERDPDEQWIRDFADSIPLAYETVMEGAADMVRSIRKGGYGEYLCFGGLLEGESVPDEFWGHYERVTGTTVEEKARQSFFTCSC